jgi:uncharacterized protein YjdB
MEGTAPITINRVPTTTKLTNLAFVGAPSTIDQGQSIDLSPYIVYTPNDATDKSLVWSVDHTYQGEVSEAGVLTAKHVGGTITVTATSVRVPSVSASHTLTITEPVVTDFTLSHSEMTMHKGDTQTLYVTAIVPDYASVSPTFSSNNTAVATISNRGLVTARGIGEAVITATIGSVERTCTVHVQPVEVTSVGFDPATVSLTVGSNLQLNPDVLPAQAKDEYPMTYVSDNEAAATVSESGLVTGIAEGQAIITATIGGVSGQITINVVAASMFTKVTDASTLAAKDTIVLATIYNNSGVIAGPRGTDNAGKKKLSVLTEGVTVTETEAYADEACRFGHFGRFGHHGLRNELEIEAQHNDESGWCESRILVKWVEVAFKRLIHLHAVVEIIGSTKAIHLAPQSDSSGQPARAFSVGLPDSFQSWRV